MRSLIFFYFFKTHNSGRALIVWNKVKSTEDKENMGHLALNWEIRFWLNMPVTQIHLSIFSCFYLKIKVLFIQINSKLIDKNNVDKTGEVNFKNEIRKINLNKNK